MTVPIPTNSLAELSIPNRVTPTSSMKFKMTILQHNGFGILYIIMVFPMILFGSFLYEFHPFFLGFCCLGIGFVVAGILLILGMKTNNISVLIAELVLECLICISLVAFAILLIFILNSVNSTMGTVFKIVAISMCIFTSFSVMFHIYYMSFDAIVMYKSRTWFWFRQKIIYSLPGGTDEDFVEYIFVGLSLKDCLWEILRIFWFHNATT